MMGSDRGQTLTLTGERGFPSQPRSKQSKIAAAPPWGVPIDLALETGRRELRTVVIRGLPGAMGVTVACCSRKYEEFSSRSGSESDPTAGDDPRSQSGVTT